MERAAEDLAAAKAREKHRIRMLAGHDGQEAAGAQPAYRVVERSHNRREVREPRARCVTVYERGAVEVIRRLAA